MPSSDAAPAAPAAPPCPAAPPAAQAEAAALLARREGPAVDGAVAAAAVAGAGGKAEETVVACRLAALLLACPLLQGRHLRRSGEKHACHTRAAGDSAP